MRAVAWQGGATRQAQEKSRAFPSQKLDVPLTVVSLSTISFCSRMAVSCKSYTCTGPVGHSAKRASACARTADTADTLGVTGLKLLPAAGRAVEARRLSER